MVEASQSVLRMWIGGQLRTMREAIKLSQAEVARHFQRSPAWPGNFESGRESLPLARGMAALLTLYGHPERIEFFEKLRQAVRSAVDWWETELFSAAAPEWLDQLLGWETISARLTAYDAIVLNGLLQTEPYACAVIGGAEPKLSAEEVRRRAALRMARQAVWHDRGETSPLQVTSVVDEFALRRPIGAPEVHQAQLLHLAEVAETTANVTVLVLPAEVGAHPSMEGSSARYEFPPEFADPGLVYMENRLAGSYYREPDQISAVKTDLEILQSLALKPEPSIACLRALAKELYP